jgi:hypothetical protein
VYVASQLIATTPPAPFETMRLGMSLLSSRRLVHAIILLTILVPLISIAQVTIKEKVEIKSKPQQRTLKNSSTCDFFAPSLFINYYGVPRLPLPASLTMNGSVIVPDSIGGNQEAVVTYQMNPYQDYQLAWKGRTPWPWGGDIYEGHSTWTGVLDRASTVDLEMYLLDGTNWYSGGSEMTMYEGGLSYAFDGIVDRGPFLLGVPVTGTGTVTGSVLPTAMFSRWAVSADPPVLYCYGSSKISFVPIDSSGGEYDPVGKELMTGTISIKVDCGGNYTYLTCGNDTAQQITVTQPWQNECHLYLNPDRGAVLNGADVATFTVTGGGRTATITVPLFCSGGAFDHFVLTATPDTILFNDWSWISGLAVDKDGNEMQLDGNTPINLATDPNTIGRFYSDVVTYDQLKMGYVSFMADVSEPTTIQDVGITASFNGRSGKTKVAVKPPPCLVVRLSKSTVAPGDTVNVVLLGSQFDGSLTAYPSDQLFNIWMNSDESLGTLQSGWGEQGSWLIGPQPFTFIAATSISTNSATVQIEGAVSSGGIAASIRNGAKDELLKQQKLSVSRLMNILSGKKGNAMVAPPVGELASKAVGITTAEGSKGSSSLKKFLARRTGPAKIATCVPTATLEVVDKKILLPLCGDLPATSFVPLRRDDDKRGCNYDDPQSNIAGYTYIDPDQLTLHVRVCSDAGVAKLEPYVMGANIIFGICTTRVTHSHPFLKSGMTVSSKDSCSIKADLTDRVSDYAKLGAVYDRIGSWITEEELIAHEEAHQPHAMDDLKELLQIEATKLKKVTLSQSEVAHYLDDDKAKEAVARQAKEGVINEMRSREETPAQEHEAQMQQIEKIKTLLTRFPKNCA